MPPNTRHYCVTLIYARKLHASEDVLLLLLFQSEPGAMSLPRSNRLLFFHIKTVDFQMIEPDHTLIV
jgi:hypothetical protein